MALRRTLEDMPLEQLGRVAAVVAVAGETETGLVDNIGAIADICARYRIHLHVDAAYGGPYVLSRKSKLFEGIQRADSITVDPHKLMWTPYSAGAVLFRDRKKHALIQNGARYLQRAENQGLTGPDNERNFGLSARVEGSMGSGGVISTWATIRLFGREGLATLLDNTLDMAEYGYRRVSTSDILRPRQELELNEFLVGLNIDNQLFRNITEDRYDEIMRLAKVYVDRIAESYISVNEKVDNGRSAWRFIVVHPYTTRVNIDELFANLEEAVVRLVEGDEELERLIKNIEKSERGWIK